MPTKAIVDTGSAATIISLDCAPNLFVDQGDRQQTPEQVMQSTMGKFSPPDTTQELCRRSSQHFIADSAEFDSRWLCCRCHRVGAEGGPYDLLVGTDVQ